MAVEPARGCGYRKVGGLYLVSKGLGEPCERLPIPILPCTVCEACLKQTRSFQWVRMSYLVSLAKRCDANIDGHCGRCPICLASPESKEKVGLLWVGKQYYPSAGDFALEADKLGVSRRVSAVPKGFVVGKTWVFVAHPEAIRVGDLAAPGVFHAFRPERIELLITPAMRDEDWVLDLAKRGVTLVEVPEDDPDHRPVQRAKGSKRKRASDALAIPKGPRRDPSQMPLFPPVA